MSAGARSANFSGLSAKPAAAYQSISHPIPQIRQYYLVDFKEV